MYLRSTCIPENSNYVFIMRKIIEHLETKRTTWNDVTLMIKIMCLCNCFYLYFSSVAKTLRVAAFIRTL